MPPYTLATRSASSQEFCKGVRHRYHKHTLFVSLIHSYSQAETQARSNLAHAFMIKYEQMQMESVTQASTSSTTKCE